MASFLITAIGLTVGYFVFATGSPVLIILAISGFVYFINETT